VLTVIHQPWYHAMDITMDILYFNSELEKVALDGSIECCAPPPRWCDLELWPFDPKTYSGHGQLFPKMHQWQKFGENPSIDTGDIAETKLPRESRTDRQRHGRTTRKHIASAGAYWRRRLKNWPEPGQKWPDAGPDSSVAEIRYMPRYYMCVVVCLKFVAMRYPDVNYSDTAKLKTNNYVMLEIYLLYNKLLYTFC